MNICLNPAYYEKNRARTPDAIAARNRGVYLVTMMVLKYHPYYTYYQIYLKPYVTIVHIVSMVITTIMIMVVHKVFLFVLISNANLLRIHF